MSRGKAILGRFMSKLNLKIISSFKFIKTRIKARYKLSILTKEEVRWLPIRPPFLFKLFSCNGVEPIMENGNPVWYFCLRNPVDRGVWQATVHGVAKSQA